VPAFLTVKPAVATGGFVLTNHHSGAVDTLPLNDIAVDVLKAQARVRHLSSDYVFPTNSGTRKGARNQSCVYIGLRASEGRALSLSRFAAYLCHAVGTGRSGALCGVEARTLEDYLNGYALRASLFLEPSARSRGIRTSAQQHRISTRRGDGIRRACISI